MATVRYFWNGFIHRGTTFMYLQYSHPLIYHLLPNVCKMSYTISASIFVDVPYWPPYRMDKFISCVVPRPSQWYFHFGKEIVIIRTHIGWVQWMFQNLPLPAGQEVHDSISSVTLCIVMKNDGVLYHEVSLFSPERWMKVVLQEHAVEGSLGGRAWCSIIPSMSYATMNITFTAHCVGCTFLDEENRMLPYIWLTFQVWFIWASPGFVHTDNSSRKVIIFLLVLVQ